jgi:hypothetical protein
MTRTRIRYLLAFVSGVLVLATVLNFGLQPSRGQQPANQPQRAPHPHPPLLLKPSVVTVSGSPSWVNAAGPTTAQLVTVTTDQSLFPPCNPAENCNPFLYPPGNNLLPTVYTNAYDSTGALIPNTLPSTPTIPYNLHDSDPTVSLINPSGDPNNTPSPQDALRALFHAIWTGSQKANEKAIGTAIGCALAILEGETPPSPCTPGAYKGFPLLHYKAAQKVKKVDPKTKNVDIHQIWYDTHIESDTAYLDVRGVRDDQWTVTYTVDVLNRGHDDFSPFAMFVDPTMGPMPMPLVGMDQSFYNMEDGTRTVFKIKMPPGKYFNLVYTWGWRAHPPRVQATENACKAIPFASAPGADVDDCGTVPNTMAWWERQVFYNNGKPDKAYAIGKLSRYAPEMRMWTALREAQDALKGKKYDVIAALFREKVENPGIAWVGWDDWRDRTKLPRNLPAAVYEAMKNDDTDVSLLYLGNTIYGHFSDGSRMEYPKWKVRGTQIKITLYNGDYFDHGYQNVDFGGARGWENQFKSSVKVGGSGCWFTFGRAWWTMNIPGTADALQNMPIRGTVTVPAAKRAATPGAEDQFGVEKVLITYNYEPSRRLRFYQFDPVHHDVAVFSTH